MRRNSPDMVHCGSSHCYLLMLGKRSLRSSRPTAEQTRSNNRRHPTPWSLAAPKFQATFEASSKMGRGCRWCTDAACCRVFQEHQSELREWREEMRSLSKERHDAEVLLIFTLHTQCPQAPPPAARESNRSATSEVSSCTIQESCGSEACREDVLVQHHFHHDMIVSHLAAPAHLRRPTG